MHSLSHYTEAAMDELFNNLGIIVAFSNKQFQEKKVEGVTYINAGSGIIVPKDNLKAFNEGMDSVVSDGIKKDLDENGKDAIIQRELANYECHISCDFEDAYDALKDYGITHDEVAAGYKVFFAHCVEHDLF